MRMQLCGETMTATAGVMMWVHGRLDERSCGDTYIFTNMYRNTIYDVRVLSCADVMKMQHM